MELQLGCLDCNHTVLSSYTDMNSVLCIVSNVLLVGLIEKLKIFSAHALKGPNLGVEGILCFKWR